MKDRKVTAIILAGGKSTRMGYDKAFIKIGGKPIIERIIATLRPLFDEIIIVTNEQKKYKSLKVRMVKDIKPNCGPLSGIHSGLVNSKTHLNFVVACDMPFLNPLLIKHMLRLSNGYDAVVVERNGRLETLCGVYNKNLTSFLKESLLSGHFALNSIIGSANLRVIPEKELKRIGSTRKDFLNVNNRRELGKILKSRRVSN